MKLPLENGEYLTGVVEAETLEDAERHFLERYRERVGDQTATLPTGTLFYWHNEEDYPIEWVTMREYIRYLQTKGRGDA